MTRTLRLSVLVLAALFGACKKEEPPAAAKPPATAEQPKAEIKPTATAKTYKVGLVTDVGGRGDNSFNDAALRGLEQWASGKKYEGGKYVTASAELKKSITPDLTSMTPPIAPQPIEPMVIQSKNAEDYVPNLDLLVEQGADLAIGNGFMLESAVETSAKKNTQAKYLLIDSPLLDAANGNTPYTLPNVRTVTFKEHEGSFLVGALAGLVTKSNKVGFVGGMEIPLIKKFEAGFRAGIKTTNAKASEALSVYTGSFDNVAAGKQVAQDLIAKGADVIYHAAGADGLGVIQAAKEARAAGKPVYVIGVDSDQYHLAPEAVLTSMIKHVDLAVYQASADVAQGKFTSGDQSLGIKEGGVGYAEVRVDFPGKAEALQKVEALRESIVSGKLKVPASMDELAAFQAAP